MSGRSPVRAAVRLRARVNWSWSGSSCHSVPQCRGHDDDVRAGFPGGPGVRDDPLLVDHADRPGLLLENRVAVGVQGVGEVGDVGAACAQDRRGARLGLGACRTGVPYTGAVEGVQGAADTVGAVVDAVVGGGGAAVVAGGGQRLGRLGRGRRGVAAVVAVRAPYTVSMWHRARSARETTGSAPASMGRKS